MGYYFATANCYGCNRLFSFNPELVPSVRVEGVRQPICRSCIERANPMREEKGLEPIQPMPGAYEPAPEYPEAEFPE